MSIAIIGGSGFGEIDSFELIDDHSVSTPYGDPSTSILEGHVFSTKNVFFLARHGSSHSIQPHKINYRANIFALKELGVKNIIALAAVGGIDENCEPGSLIVPHQILDYSYAREMTFFDEVGNLAHAEFTEPYSQAMREVFIRASNKANVEVLDSGVYAVTQGPRFETAAEIVRYQRDGASVVGMTAMPEAVLARELGMGYLTIALSVNFAAGIKPGVIEHADIHSAYSLAANKLYSVLPHCLAELANVDAQVPELIKP
jgi:5'-deoxy-5'-methylthioadenosine phosphorylase